MSIVDDIRLKVIEQIMATGVIIGALVFDERTEVLLLDEFFPQPRTQERLPRGGSLWGVPCYLWDDMLPPMPVSEILFYTTAPSFDYGFTIECEPEPETIKARMAHIEALRSAWVTTGPQPSYHNQVKNKLRAQWPTLVRAIEDLLPKQGAK